MNIAEALKYSSEIEHISGKAQVKAFPDMGFSLLTVGKASFVIQDLPDAMAVNGVPLDRHQVRGFAARVRRETGIRFDRGWRPKGCPSRWMAGVMGMCLAVVCVIRHRWRI